MKRDFDLVRLILREVAALQPGKLIKGFTFDGVDPDVIQAHAVLLVQAGLLEGNVTRPMSGSARIAISGLSWAGHDFLDAINDDTLWAKAKKSVLAPAGGVAFSVLFDWAKAEAKVRLGLPQ